MKKLKSVIWLLIILGITACSPDEPVQKNAGVSNVSYNVSKISGIARIEPLKRIYTISSEEPGIVAAIYKKEGDTVSRGVAIVALTNDVEQAQVEQAKSRLNTQQNQIVALKAALAAQSIRLQKAAEDYRRNQRLFKGGALTEQELLACKAIYDGLNQDVIAAESNGNEAKSRLVEIKKEIEYDQQLANRRIIKAQENGLILSLDVRPGSAVNTNQAIGEFAPKGPLIAVTEVDEIFASRIKVGQRGYIFSQGTSDTLAYGSITYVAPSLKKKSLFSDQSDNLEDRRVREIHMQLNSTKSLLIGSRVDCIIKLK